MSRYNGAVAAGFRIEAEVNSMQPVGIRGTVVLAGPAGQFAACIARAGEADVARVGEIGGRHANPDIAQIVARTGLRGGDVGRQRKQKAERERDGV